MFVYDVKVCDIMLLQRCFVIIVAVPYALSRRGDSSLLGLGVYKPGQSLNAFLYSMAICAEGVV